MKLLANPKFDYLLEAGLEVLHQESREWLENIRFWQDELRFFHHLIATNQKKQPKSLQKYQHLLNLIVDMKQILAEKLNNELVTHEQYLGKLFANDATVNNRKYRAKHREMAEKLNTFEREFRDFKRRLFDFEKH